MFTTRSTSVNSNRWGTSASRSSGPCPGPRSSSRRCGPSPSGTPWASGTRRPWVRRARGRAACAGSCALAPRGGARGLRRRLTRGEPAPAAFGVAGIGPPAGAARAGRGRLRDRPSSARRGWRAPGSRARRPLTSSSTRRSSIVSRMRPPRARPRPRARACACVRRRALGGGLEHALDGAADGLDGVHRVGALVGLLLLVLLRHGATLVSGACRARPSAPPRRRRRARAPARATGARAAARPAAGRRCRRCSTITAGCGATRASRPTGRR